DRFRGGRGGGRPRRRTERRTDGFQRGTGNRVHGRLDLDQRLADGQAGGRPEQRRLAGGGGGGIGEGAGGVGWAEGLGAQAGVGPGRSAPVVAGDVTVLE